MTTEAADPGGWYAEACRRARATQRRRAAAQASTAWPAFAPPVALADGPLGAVQAADREIARQTALRARAVAAFAASRPATADRAQGEPGAMSPERWNARPEILRPVSEWAAPELAVALSLSAPAAEQLLIRSLTLVHRLPGTLAALEAGALHPGHLWPLLDKVAPIENDRLRAEVEAGLLRWAADRVVTPAQLGAKARREVARRDARAAARRLQQSLTERNVQLRPHPVDGMAAVTVLAAMPEAQALYRALAGCADTLDDPDDPRTRGQKMVDCLLDLVLRPGESDLPPVQVLLTVVASLATLAGGDGPGEIDGQPVPAEMIRQLLAALTAPRQALPDDGDPVFEPGQPESATWQGAEQEELERWWAEMERRVLSAELVDPGPFIEQDPAADRLDDLDDLAVAPAQVHDYAVAAGRLPADAEATGRLPHDTVSVGRPLDEDASPDPFPEDDASGLGWVSVDAVSPPDGIPRDPMDLVQDDRPLETHPDNPGPHCPSDGSRDSGWWAAADHALDGASQAMLRLEQELTHARQLVRTAVAADRADESEWQAGPAGRLTDAEDAITALRSMTQAQREHLAELLSTTGGGGLADRPRLALTDALSGTLLALTDLPGLTRAGTCGRAACRTNPAGCTHDLGDRPSLGPPGPTDAYRPAADLDRWVRARDRRCRFPGCRRRVPRGGELDHHRPYPQGATSADNLVGYCTTDHRGKHQAPGWDYQLEPDGTLTVTTPTGLVAVTSPPPYWAALPRVHTALPHRRIGQRCRISQPHVPGPTPPLPGRDLQSPMRRPSCVGARWRHGPSAQ